MPYFTQELEIDIDEFLDECTSREMEDLIESLEERGYIKPKSSKGIYIQEIEFNNMLLKIMENKHQISEQEELVILNIYKKIV